MFYMKAIGYVDARTNNVQTLLERISRAVRMDIVARGFNKNNKWELKTECIIKNEMEGLMVEYHVVLQGVREFDLQLRAQAYNGPVPPVPTYVLKGNSIEELFGDVNRAKLYMLMS